MSFLIFGAGLVCGVGICVVAAFVFMEATAEPRACMACGGQHLTNDPC